jgi:sulfoacetaldehyde acetyltransferase
MFYGDLQTTIPGPMPIEISAGGQESLRRAADLLLSAKNPVILSGTFKTHPHFTLDACV